MVLVDRDGEGLVGGEVVVGGDGALLVGGAGLVVDVVAGFEPG